MYQEIRTASVFVMNATQIKILVSVFFVLALWRVFELPGVATAFWAFITVGAIPGTEKVLGTEAVLRILCILFAITFFLIFRKEFIASLPKRAPKQPKAAAPVVHMGKLATTFATRERIVVILKQQQDRRALAPVRPIVVLLGKIAAWIIQLTYWAEMYCRRGSVVLGRSVKQGYRFSIRHTAAAAKVLYRSLLFVGRYIVYAALIAWKMAEPHIRNFDRWLDTQLHANKSTAEILKFMGKASRATSESYHRAEQATRKLRENK